MAVVLCAAVLKSLHPIFDPRAPTASLWARTESQEETAAAAESCWAVTDSSQRSHLFQRVLYINIIKMLLR